MISTDWFKALI